MHAQKVGRIVVSKDVQALIFRTCEYVTLIAKGTSFCDRKIIQLFKCHQMGPYKGKRGAGESVKSMKNKEEDVTMEAEWSYGLMQLLGLKMKKMQVASTLERTRKQILP